MGNCVCSWIRGRIEGEGGWGGGGKMGGVIGKGMEVLRWNDGGVRGLGDDDGGFCEENRVKDWLVRREWR